MSNYRIYTIGNTSLSQTQCDVATIACIKMNVKGGAGNPGQISDTQVKCGSYVSVAPTFYGVEVPAAAGQQTIAGTAAAGGCNVPPIQLIHLDGPLDPSVTLCNNSNASVVSCGTGQRGFAAGQYYTQIGSAYTTQGLATNTLYAVPFIAPVGGTISKFSIEVPTAPGGSGATCEVGIYNSVNGLPTTLYVDSGSMTIPHAFTGIRTISGPNTFLIASIPYYLAIGCGAAVTILATVPGAASTNLVGLIAGETTTAGPPTTIAANANTYYTGSYVPSPGTLPSPFGAATAVTSGNIPNVWVSP